MAKQFKWTATVYDVEGNICTRINSKGNEEDLVKGFDKVSQADRWSDLRLVNDAASDSYAIVEHAEIPLSTRITRDEAIGRVLGKNGPGAVMHVSKGSGGLGFGVKSHPSHSVFSRG